MSLVQLDLVWVKLKAFLEVCQLKQKIDVASLTQVLSCDVVNDVMITFSCKQIPTNDSRLNQVYLS